MFQKIYSHTPDYVINTGNIFIHQIDIDVPKSFLNLTGEYLPSGMEFNLKDISLEWIPTQSQLGFHEFSYVLEDKDIKEVCRKREITGYFKEVWAYLGQPTVQ